MQAPFPLADPSHCMSAVQVSPGFFESTQKPELLQDWPGAQGLLPEHLVAHTPTPCTATPETEKPTQTDPVAPGQSVSSVQYERQ
jgi:hypothetical protein